MSDCKCAHDFREHSPAIERAQRKLKWAALLACAFMIVEIVGGVLSNSIAIIADAAHMASDLAGILISVFALWLTARPASHRFTFGWYRAEIIGVCISVMLIWGLTGWLVYEAVQRLQDPPEVNGKVMFIVAAIGIGVNLVLMSTLHQGGHGHSHGGHGHSHGGHSHSHSHSHSHVHAHDADCDDDDDIEVDEGAASASVNVRAAYIHILGDLIQSIGVVIAAVLIWIDPEKFRIADPICTFVFSLIVLYTTWHLISDAMRVLMQMAPADASRDSVTEALLSTPGVKQVHDVHVWSVSLGKPVISAHIVISSAPDFDAIRQEAAEMLARRFGLRHSTLQVELLSDSTDTTGFHTHEVEGEIESSKQPLLTVNVN
ncbi:MAG: hypothetical protein MHM6MM_003178 [Cercozoa sp. M6MM]